MSEDTSVPLISGQDVYNLIMELKPFIDKRPAELVEKAALTIAVSVICPDIDAARLVDLVHATEAFIQNYGAN